MTCIKFGLLGSLGSAAVLAVLVFIGSKIFIGDFVFDRKVPASLSLGVTAALILAGIGLSLWRTRAGAGSMQG